MSDSVIPTNGFDIATGHNGLAGTPAPSSAIVKAFQVSLEEPPPSPQYDFGEQGTIKHTFNCDQDTGFQTLISNPRGTVLTDSLGLVSRVLSTTLSQRPGQQASVEITAEASYIVPPDEFSVEPVEFNPSIYRHPRYAPVLTYNLNSAGSIIDSMFTTGPVLVSIIQGAGNFQNLGAQSQAQSFLNASNVGDSTVLALAAELLTKVQQGFDIFYLAGWKVTYSSFSYFPPDLNPGGYIEDPVASGFLPIYFWQDSNGNNIFTKLAQTVVPALYGPPGSDSTSVPPGGISWLRQADSIAFERTWFKSTNTWVGGPYGQWDIDIYSKIPPPPNPFVPPS